MSQLQEHRSTAGYQLSYETEFAGKLGWQRQRQRAFEQLNFAFETKGMINSILWSISTTPSPSKYNIVPWPGAKRRPRAEGPRAMVLISIGI